MVVYGVGDSAEKVVFAKKNKLLQGLGLVQALMTSNGLPTQIIFARRHIKRCGL